MLHTSTTGSGYVTLYERVVGLVVSAIAGYRRRAELRESRQRFLDLTRLDDRTLDDIGVSRGDIHNAAELPLGIDAATAARRAFCERRSRRALRRRDGA